MSTGATLKTLDSRQRNVRFPVSQAQRNLLRVGQPAKVTATPISAVGRIPSVGYAASSSGGLATFPVVVSLPVVSGLRPGMAARATINVKHVTRGYESLWKRCTNRDPMPRSGCGRTRDTWRSVCIAADQRARRIGGLFPASAWDASHHRGHREWRNHEAPRQGQARASRARASRQAMNHVVRLGTASPAPARNRGVGCQRQSSFVPGDVPGDSWTRHRRGDKLSRVNSVTRTSIAYLVLLVIAIVGVDLLFFRHHIWPRLLMNVGIVMVFVALYLRFVRNP